MTKTRVLLVEDNRILRDGINAIINEQADLVIAGSLGGTEDILHETRRLKPQVVLIDAGLRNRNGLRIVSLLTRESPRTRVIGMGLIPTQLDIVEFVQAGASGFILKDATVGDVLGTIRAVARGVKVLPPLLTGSLFTHVVEHALTKGKAQADGAVRMTKREREIVALISDGLSNKEIAQRLNIEVYTVKSHVHNILDKLALHSRLQISVFVHNEGPV
jgi:two-component system, NarL family, nitrate/nitrite response regulator NarL